MTTRSNRGCLYSFLLLAGLAICPTTWGSEQEKDSTSSSSSTNTSNNNEQCGLYLAVSSTAKDYTVWGVYAGKEYGENELIGQGELAVNTINLRANNLLMGIEDPDEELQDRLIRSVEFLEESFWVPDGAGGKFEVGKGQRVITAISGPGFLGAFDPSLTNADWDHKITYKRSAIGETRGLSHASRGAITPFYGNQLRSTSKIIPGAEIMIHYGSNYEEEQKKEELQRTDYDRIDETIEKMIEFFSKHKEELNEDSKMEIFKFITRDVLNAAVGLKKAKKITSILPKTPEELVNVKTAGGTLAYSRPKAFRSLEWLQENGRCMDNIRAGASTIPDAGRGAFATRKIPQRAVVTPVPMLQIPEFEILDMHPVYRHEENKEWLREDHDITGQQLLLNYCFGHHASSMLLYPTGGGAALINHASKEKANAKLVWSDHPASSNSEWFKMDPYDLVSDDNRYLGLMMEIVATRDIEEGEEIFIDYGPEWEEAWNEHVSAWNEAKKSGEIPAEWPAKAIDMNEEYKTKPYKTEKELKDEPYPDGVALVSFLMVAETSEEGTESDPKIWTQPPHGTAFHSDNLFEPDIVDRVKIVDESLDMPYNYTVRWTNKNGEHTFVKDIPHEAFTFVDEPEKGDQFIENPFRHYIGIPDDIFPQGPWRNMDEMLAAGAASEAEDVTEVA